MLPVAYGAVLLEDLITLDPELLPLLRRTDDMEGVHAALKERMNGIQPGLYDYFMAGNLEDPVEGTQVYRRALASRVAEARGRGAA